MNNYDSKIITIKETEKKLLEIAKTKIEENNSLFNENIEKVIKLLNYDSKMVKKYEAVVNAQKLIFELTEKLKNAKNVVEVIEIRKKINYYINKVKKEMKNRGIEDSEYNNYCENSIKLRKTISEYIRYLKREDKIREIEKLNSNINSLTEDETIKLRKLVKNELSYGKRNSLNNNEKIEINKKDKEIKKKSELAKELDKYFSKKELPKEEKRSLKEELDQLFANKELPKKEKRSLKEELDQLFANKELPKKEKRSLKEELEQRYPKKEVKEEKRSLKEELDQLFANKELPKEEKRSLKDELELHLSKNEKTNNVVDNQYNNVHDYLDDQIKSFDTRYKIEKTHIYTKNPIKNLVIYTKNLPIIIQNKKKIKYMIRDYRFYYTKSELDGYCQYTTKNNSIINNLKKSIIGSSLKDKEEFYAFEHEKCINWIIDYCNKNNMKIVFNK